MSALDFLLLHLLLDDIKCTCLEGVAQQVLRILEQHQRQRVIVEEVFGLLRCLSIRVRCRIRPEVLVLLHVPLAELLKVLKDSCIRVLTLLKTIINEIEWWTRSCVLTRISFFGCR